MENATISYNLDPESESYTTTQQPTHGLNTQNAQQRVDRRGLTCFFKHKYYSQCFNDFLKCFRVGRIFTRLSKTSKSALHIWQNLTDSLPRKHKAVLGFIHFVAFVWLQDLLHV